MATITREVTMTTVMRVGAGTLRETFSPDLLEEIRIMAEAGQAHLAETVRLTRRPRLSFAALLSRVLAGARA
jgi:hypothetical protein